MPPIVLDRHLQLDSLLEAFSHGLKCAGDTRRASSAPRLCSTCPGSLSHLWKIKAWASSSEAIPRQELIASVVVSFQLEPREQERVSLPRHPRHFCVLLLQPCFVICCCSCCCLFVFVVVE